MIQEKKFSQAQEGAEIATDKNNSEGNFIWYEVNLYKSKNFLTFCSMECMSFIGTHLMVRSRYTGGTGAGVSNEPKYICKIQSEERTRPEVIFCCVICTVINSW